VIITTAVLSFFRKFVGRVFICGKKIIVGVLKMKKILVKLMIGAVMIFALSGHASAETVETSAPAVFEDVEAGHWAKEQIELAVKKGYISGFPDGTFRPDDKVSRAQFIRMLVDALKLPHVEKGEPWYQPYVAAAIEMKILEENEFDNYEVDLSRLEMVRLIIKSIGSVGENASDKKYVVLATEMGLIHGTATGELNLTKFTRRAESVVVIERVLKKLRSHSLEVNDDAVAAAYLL